MTRIFSDRGFDRQFSRLPRKFQLKFYERAALFAADPRAPLLHNHPLEGKYEGMRSINITGDLRAVYRESENNSAFFVEIGTHHQLFRS
ncbi:MAG: hypothetical protein A3D65_02025 [Candidatus Lloydbacteria bacterium RIFCSPHIGHO2_02_FULL_50_13]|uniref:Plasmid stabilization protein n=1 Tax=Candidatus Lloydbacteria bacterium RIFCSPHIGHO2_02_FULL_50_13 TaxID=1798661 RepID=A0A1G2D1R6_9BACT|nr:MAG: hypothetical protein A3D65_02025 [Candidatus Lloydbacteria bacterium RIFCSPHIGHO2_02_FULL_50_13]